MGQAGCDSHVAEFTAGRVCATRQLMRIAGRVFQRFPSKHLHVQRTWRVQRHGGVSYNAFSAHGPSIHRTDKPTGQSFGRLDDGLNDIRELPLES
jgi:hypothetical protein